MSDIKKRFDRIVEILVQLQSKRIVRAQDLAERFEVSLRTIYRDIKSLEQAGIPLIGEAGTGYSIIEGYKLPPVSFNKEEALSFVATEKLAEKFLDKTTNKHYTSAMFKIKAVLKSTDQDLLGNVQEQIIMRKQNAPIFLDQAPQALSSTLEAIAHKKQLQIVYQGLKDDLGHTRCIEPIGIVHEIGYWYIVAFCLERNAIRQFRSDRIQQANLLDSIFTQEHISMAAYMEQQTCEPKMKTTIRIRVEKEMAPYVRWQRQHYGYVSETVLENHVDMLFESEDYLQEFSRWILMFADKIQILEPFEVKNRVFQLIEEIQENLKI